MRIGSAEVAPAPKSVLAFTRRVEGDNLLCVFELAGVATQVPVPAHSKVMLAVCGGERIEGPTLILPPFGGAILQLVAPS